MLWNIHAHVNKIRSSIPRQPLSNCMDRVVPINDLKVKTKFIYFLLLSNALLFYSTRIASLAHSYPSTFLSLHNSNHSANFNSAHCQRKAKCLLLLFNKCKLWKKVCDFFVIARNAFAVAIIFGIFDLIKLNQVNNNNLGLQIAFNMTHRWKLSCWEF